MRKYLSIQVLLFYATCSLAQTIKLSGIIYDSVSNRPVQGATVLLNPGGETVVSDESGRFLFLKLEHPGNFISVTSIGFQPRVVNLAGIEDELVVKLLPRRNLLTDVVITANAKSPYKALAETDIEMRGVANSQEILRLVPGLFIGQHQGGGKAEQIFLRGFDEDHGKDIRINVDGIPVNMVSHAHAQGYADSHFIIPETIEKTTFNKGPYDAEKGDQAVTGYLDFVTAGALSNNTIAIEGGQYKTYRLLAMVNLLNEKPEMKGNSWYAAAEYNFSNGYFQHLQHFTRMNVFSKLNYSLSRTQQLVLSASTFHSSWKASGQIPERAVEAGLISHYGAIDPDEGGETGRHNINIALRSSTLNGGVIRNQVFYSRYDFTLYSNFTFFLVDSINGDQIKQKEKRSLFGYNGSYTHEGHIGEIKINTFLGVNMRLDIVANSELSHTANRHVLLSRQKLGDITVLGSGVFLEELIRVNKRWRIKAGVRADHFYYRYRNKLQGDTAFRQIGNYHKTQQIISPKLNIFYNVSRKAQMYLSFGKGFHTNDARVVAGGISNNTIPAAYGIDAGIIVKPSTQFLVHAALWYMYLNSEYVYAGDGGTIDFSGKTRRTGVDLSIRYQPVKAVLLDLDLNAAHGRSIGDAKGNNYIPLAPVWSSSAGISLINETGWNAGLRYRYLSKRPANTDYSLACKSYFVNDLMIKYKASRFEYGLVINNLFDVKWKETQFEAETRLKEEPEGISDLTFTAGTKFLAKICFSYRFGFRSDKRVLIRKK